jgi:large subunit ribosomal protein L24
MAGMKIKKGDRVRVLSGKDRGKEGVVMRALPSERKVIVDGVNVAKKHQKATQMTMQGGIIDKDMPIDVSNVAIIDPSDGKPARVGYRVNADGTKTRVSRRTGTEIPERGEK